MSPRTKLLNNKAMADKVRDMVDSELFDMAADAALLQYIETMHIPISMEDNAMVAARILGAKDFLSVFRRIADVQRPASTGLPDNLNFKA